MMKNRKIAVAILVLVVCMIMAACDKGYSSAGQDEVNPKFHATVLRVSEKSILVARDGNGTDLIWVSADVGDIRVGDKVEIEYDGMIAESYPAQIHNVYGIAVVERLLTEDVLSQVKMVLTAEKTSYFDYQMVEDIVAIGCEYDGSYGVVYLQDGTIHAVIKQEDMVSLDVQTAAWRDDSLLSLTGKQVFLLADPEIAGLHIPGEQDSWIYVYQYPALLAVEAGYQPGLDGSLAGGYVPNE